MSPRPALIIHPEAADEARRARLWYEARSTPAARNFAQKLEVAIDHILDSPESWPFVVGELTRSSLGGPEMPLRATTRVMDRVILAVMMAASILGAHSAPELRRTPYKLTLPEQKRAFEIDYQPRFVEILKKVSLDR